MGHEQDAYIAVTAAKNAYSNTGAENQEAANATVETLNKLWKSDKFTTLPHNEGFYRNDATGYFGYSVICVDTKQIYIAHRGSANAANWIESNKNIALKKVPSAWIDAYKFSFRLRQEYGPQGYQFIETGHSLGGVFAILNAFYFRYLAISTEKNNSRSITFDNPGCLELIEDLLDYTTISTHLNKIGATQADSAIKSLQAVVSKGQKKLTPEISTEMQQYFYCYLSAPNIVNTTNTQIGNLWRLYISHTAALDIQANITRLQSIFEFSKVILDGFENPLKTAIKTILKTGATFLAQDVGTASINYIIRMHDINRIADAFLPNYYMPMLVRKIECWPSLMNLSTSTFWTTQVVSSGQKNNQDCELSIHQIQNYQVGGFWLPTNQIEQKYIKLLIEENKQYSDIFNSWMHLFFCLLKFQEDFSKEIGEIYFDQSHTDNLPSNRSSWLSYFLNGCGDERTNEDKEEMLDQQNNTKPHINELIKKFLTLKAENSAPSSNKESLKKDMDELIGAIHAVNNKKYHWAKISKSFVSELEKIIRSVYNNKFVGGNADTNNNNSGYHWPHLQNSTFSNNITFFKSVSSSSKVIPKPGALYKK
ncbi:MAG: hypothetical protein WC756_20765 [Taibaiella sp.]